jgi:hypothetical protein
VKAWCTEMLLFVTYICMYINVHSTKKVYSFLF